MIIPMRTYVSAVCEIMCRNKSEQLRYYYGIHIESIDVIIHIFNNIVEIRVLTLRKSAKSGGLAKIIFFLTFAR